jgi:hypothetical protein
VSLHTGTYSVQLRDLKEPIELTLRVSYEWEPITAESRYEPASGGCLIEDIDVLIEGRIVALENWSDDLADAICRAIYKERGMAA